MNRTAGKMQCRLAGLLAAVAACAGVTGCSVLPSTSKPSGAKAPYYAPDQQSQLAYEAALKQAESQAVTAECDCCN